MDRRKQSPSKENPRPTTTREVVPPLDAVGENGFADPLTSGLRLTHIRLIVALEESQRISTAALRLNISQPAASRMLAEMQRLLTVPLVTRSARGVTLTPFGVSFARQARAMLLQLRQATQEITDLKLGHGGAVSIGAVTAPAIKLAVPAFNRIRDEFPKLKVTIKIETSNVLMSEMLASHHDFIIARIPNGIDPRLFVCRQIGVERASLIVRRGHPLSGRQKVHLGDLSTYDWVLQPSGSILRDTVERLFVRQNIPLPLRLLDTSSTLLSLIMVCRTNAIAALGSEIADFLVDDKDMGARVEILPLAPAIVVGPYSLIHTADRNLTPAAQRFYDFILDEVGTRDWQIND